MAKIKYYAVKQGRCPGIYMNWNDCKAQVDGYPNAEYKSFSSPVDAKLFLEDENQKQQSAFDFTADVVQDVEEPIVEKVSDDTKPYAFVDGSFNSESNVYGFGGFICANGGRHPIMGSGNNPEIVAMRNVAGEMMGAVAAVKKAEELGLSEIKLIYDYKGIEDWVTGEWKANKKVTQAYRDFMNSPNRKTKIVFEKVKGHSGVEGNEIADVMAKHAVGITLTKSQNELLQSVCKNDRSESLSVIMPRVPVKQVKKNDMEFGF